MTNSRLSISEARINTLEALVLNISVSNNQNMEQFLQTNKVSKLGI